MIQIIIKDTFSKVGSDLVAIRARSSNRHKTDLNPIERPKAICKGNEIDFNHNLNSRVIGLVINKRLTKLIPHEQKRYINQVITNGIFSIDRVIIEHITVDLPVNDLLKHKFIGSYTFEKVTDKILKGIKRDIMSITLQGAKDIQIDILQDDKLENTIKRSGNFRKKQGGKVDNTHVTLFNKVKSTILFLNKGLNTFS